jgi:hypothetical protein
VKSTPPDAHTSVRVLLCYHKPLKQQRNFCLFPFQEPEKISALKLQAFPLGPANPRTNAVHAEPLSTTVIKGFI